MGFQVVTGAFGYSGQYIATRLLDQGVTVRTITNSANRPNPFGDRVKAESFHFDEPEKLASILGGADVLYNTYWVRFNHKSFTYSSAVDNTLRLLLLNVLTLYGDRIFLLIFCRVPIVGDRPLIGGGK